MGLACAASLALLLAGREARADDAQELELGKNRFDAGQYEEAAKRFLTMLDPAVPPCDKEAPRKSGRCRITDKELIEQARTFAAASLIALKRTPEADALVEKVVRTDPAFAPNPALFPAEVIDRFTEVKGRLRAELEAIARKEAEAAAAKQMAQQKAKDDEKAWLDELQRLASHERIVQKNSRFVAALPFGAGQFQNGDTGLGWAFAVSEVLTGAAAIVFEEVERYNEQIDPNVKSASGAPVVREDLRSRIQTMATLNRISLGAWAGITIAGIIQAQIAFVPEKVTVVTRPIPKRPPPVVIPTVSMGPGSVGLGIAGRF